jgi:hypothetical protein
MTGVFAVPIQLELDGGEFVPRCDFKIVHCRYLLLFAN